VGVQGILSRLAKNAKYQTLLRNAWNQVRFAQFMDVHENSRNSANGTSVLGVFTGDMTKYDLTDGIRNDRNVPFNGAANKWGYKYNYRTDIADLMRRFGLGRELAFCERPKIEAAAVTTGGQFFVEDLFDLDEQSQAYVGTAGTVQLPLWHGKDEIKDEVFEP